MSVIDCREAPCSLMLHPGWNTWEVVRALPEGAEVTSAMLTAELKQLLGVTALGLVSGLGTWFPSADASHVGIHVFLGGNWNIDDVALARARDELSARNYGGPGIPEIAYPCAAVQLAERLFTVALVDFFWGGASVSIPWPATAFVRTPTLPGLAGQRIAVPCAHAAEWMVAEAWGAPTIDRDAPKSRVAEATEALGSAVDKITAAPAAAVKAAASQAAVISVVGAGALLWWFSRGRG